MKGFTLALVVLSATLAAGDFEVNFYQAVAPEQGNFVIAPPNVANTLSMAYLGAVGETEAEMAKVLGFQALTRETVAQAFGELPPEISALWLPEGEPLRHGFQTLVKDNYPDGLHEALFEQPTIVTHEINAWMGGKTGGRVPGLLEEKSVNSSSSMVLIGAYLPQESWVFPFASADTDDDNMMNAVISAPYLQTDDYTMVAIPYQEERALVVVLPSNPNRRPTITVDVLQNAMNKMEIKEVKISLPKFKASTRVFSREFLQEMGMKKAFTKEADFSGISGQPDLYISQMAHQAVFSVDEEGSGHKRSQSKVKSSLGRKFDVEFVASRPFAYMLIDAKTGHALIMGRHTPGN